MGLSPKGMAARTKGLGPVMEIHLGFHLCCPKENVAQKSLKAYQYALSAET